MKLYIAGAFTDRECIKRAMSIAERYGHEITHKWPLSKQSGQDAAIADIRGVGDADMLVAVMDNDTYAYKGTRHEIGAALLRREQTGGRYKIWMVCSGGDPRGKKDEDIPECMLTCFEMTADRYFDSLDEALTALNDLK
jgi:hypothetical protein